MFVREGTARSANVALIWPPNRKEKKKTRRFDRPTEVAQLDTSSYTAKNHWNLSLYYRVIHQLVSTYESYKTDCENDQTSLILSILNWKQPKKKKKKKSPLPLACIEIHVWTQISQLNIFKFFFHQSPCVIIAFLCTHVPLQYLIGKGIFRRFHLDRRHFPIKCLYWNTQLM